MLFLLLGYPTLLRAFYESSSHHQAGASRAHHQAPRLKILLDDASLGVCRVKRSRLEQEFCLLKLGSGGIVVKRSPLKKRPCFVKGGQSLPRFTGGNYSHSTFPHPSAATTQYTLCPTSP